MRRKKVNAFDAKTHLGELLRDAEAGQSFLIVRRGKPVAHLDPAAPDEQRPGLKLLASSFREVRERIGGAIQARELINEGRRL